MLFTILDSHKGAIKKNLILSNNKINVAQLTYPRLGLSACLRLKSPQSQVCSFFQLISRNVDQNVDHGVLDGRVF